MKFSFGIVTSFDNPQQIQQVIDSIRCINIPEYEILLIGPKNDQFENVIEYEENEKVAYVTRKKNILVNSCKYDNVVIMHDYYLFDSEWYKNFIEFGDDWDVCSNAQLLITGKRHFTDWVTWDSPSYPRWTSLSYDDWTHTKYMYQSGGYMVVKKDFYKKCPMNESLSWGQYEDVEWSLRMRTTANWKCNGNSIVKHNKVHRDA